jgi:hypothetical protein
VVKGISKAEARRRAAAIRANENSNEPLISGENLQYLLAFRATMAPPEHREQVQQAVVAICGRATHIKGKASFIKRVSDCSVLSLWAARSGRSLDWRDLMDHAVIHEFARAPHPGSSDDSHAERVKRLRNLASAVHPGESAPPRTQAGHRKRIKPPYTPEDDAAHIRIVRGSTASGRPRALRALVALARGAGASSSELRTIRREDIADFGKHGIDVHLGSGPSERVVPVLREYERLLREGLRDAPDTGLLFGRGGKNVINEIITGSGMLSSDAAPLEVNRLRTTWLATQMRRPLPLGTLMAASGLQGARTFGDIFEAMFAAGQFMPRDFKGMR